MRVQILLVLICGVLFVAGSPLDKKNVSKKAVERLKENKTTKTAELNKPTESDNKLEAAKEEKKKEDSLESLLSAEHSEDLPSEDVKVSAEAEALLSAEDKVEQSPEETKLDESAEPVDLKESLEKLEESAEKLVNSVEENILKESEEKLEAPVEESAEKLKESLEKQEVSKSEESADKPLATSETSEIPAGQPVPHANLIIHATSIFQSRPLVPDALRKVGPVEVGLRNVIASSAAATEEYFMEMSALNTEISHMIISKSEIITSKTINSLYEPLSKVENLIKQSGECGQTHEASLNAIFKDIDSSLKSCSKNLSIIDDQFKSDNVGALTSLSFITDEIGNLPESCDMSQNFAVGTFCVVNNLAELNVRVLNDVSFVKENAAKTEERVAAGLAESEACQRKMSDSVSDKLAKLLDEVRQKCVERKNAKSK